MIHRETLVLRAADLATAERVAGYWAAVFADDAADLAARNGWGCYRVDLMRPEEIGAGRFRIGWEAHRA